MTPISDVSPFEIAGFERVLDLVPIAVLHTDGSGNCRFVNRRWSALTGLSNKAAAGRGWLQILAAEDRERALAYHSSSSPVEEVRDAFTIRTVSGVMRTLQVNIVPLFDDGVRLVGHLCACVDITERHEAEGALQTLTHAYRERLKELDCLYEISHIVERAGGSLERILRDTVRILPDSWEYPDVTCARIAVYELDVQTNNYAPSSWRQRATIFIDGAEAGYVEVGYLAPRPPRDEGPFLAQERRLIDNIAERLGHIATRILTAERLRDRDQELRERLTHLSRVSTMGEMASSLAHELNQPLTAVTTYAQAVRRLAEAGATDSGELLHVLDRIAGEALRAGKIVHRLKELVRRRETRREACDVNAHVRDIEQLATADARLHDASLRLELSEPLPLAFADGIQIQQVLLNLIRNAVDAVQTAEAGSRDVVVRTARGEGNTVLIGVSDRGCGTREDQAEQLFQPFFTTKDTGLGVGLSISRSIVTSHGGKMWFTPNPEGGTTFFFTLPTAEVHDAAS